MNSTIKNLRTSLDHTIIGATSFHENILRINPDVINLLEKQKIANQVSQVMELPDKIQKYFEQGKYLELY
ncbi:MAG: hypothetical protein MHPSP_000148, partial [Paramarteilia canceri]